MKLNRDFYNNDSITVAKALLGKILVHEIDGQKIKAKIVETEAYKGPQDKAAHSYGGRRTARVEVMYGEAGYSYVFMIYGMHYCFNVVCNEKEIPEAVLVRAVEPIQDIEWIAQQRFKKSYHELSKNQRKNLSNGPGKLCQALAITRDLNAIDLCGDKLYIEDGDQQSFAIIATKRIGIDYAQEAIDYPWRFYIEDNDYVSIK